MSHRLLTANEIDLLSLSLNFRPSPSPISMFNVRDQFLAFRRSVKPRPNELNISLNFAQQMFSDVACCSVMFSRVGGQTG